MTARDEQETTVTWYRDDVEVSIYTSNMVHLRRLRKLVSTRDYVREIRGGDNWGEFACDATFFHVFSAIRGKRQVSEATRGRLAVNLAVAREAQAAS